MFAPVVTKDPSAVAAEVQATYRELFPEGDPLFVPRAFAWTTECFTGKHPDYQAIDARYHDLEHTMQGTLCFGRLLRARRRVNAHPELPQRLFELGLLAMLFHDTGYLKRRDDLSGTGAKYTVTHVSRSAEFAAVLLAEKGFNPTDVEAVQNMIRCTGVDAALKGIPFHDDPEKIVGHALGTADLLGQMAADDYVEKLPVLYSEFAEATEFSKEKTHFIALFTSAYDLLKRTPTFWENYVRLKLERDFGGLYRFLNDPYPDGGNYYLACIEVNMERIRQQLSSNTTTFFPKRPSDVAQT
jgi:hypothetical protein